jgi:hypothetical protein
MSAPVRSAAAIAAGVRDGSLKATEVLEGYMAEIDRREGDIHAFNLVTADRAREAAAAVDAAVAAGRDPGPLAVARPRMEPPGISPPRLVEDWHDGGLRPAGLRALVLA